MDGGLEELWEMSKWASTFALTFRCCRKRQKVVRTNEAPTFGAT